MSLGAFGQKPFSAALPPARERGASGLCLHACTKAMLPFAGSLGSLESAFHNFWERRAPSCFLPVRSATGRTRPAASSDGYGKRRESVVNRTAKNGVLESWSGENPN